MSFINAEHIQQCIVNQLPCQHIEVHGDGRHWFATIISDRFEGLSRIARHQLVYRCLGDQIDTDQIHALSMKLQTPIEAEHQQSNKGSP